ncbi:hypothetical protein BDP27DRAFT_1377944 [Rhodocollybia butyracea]|uniref:Uncharacterized protein n=1 Tax=Rhodocollybia butyracea TaxID=206335 RepID=A0A9P5P4A6_9AGAR|nr:hypothetical protein BDP27DRAFT_1377944 [Rhodocollybia butyracea]
MYFLYEIEDTFPFRLGDLGVSSLRHTTIADDDRKLVTPSHLHLLVTCRLFSGCRYALMEHSRTASQNTARAREESYRLAYENGKQIPVTRQFGLPSVSKYPVQVPYQWERAHTTRPLSVNSVEYQQGRITKVLAEHATIQAKLSSNEELQTLTTGLSSKNIDNHATGGGYMGRIADACALVAPGAAEEQARMKLEMSRKELLGIEEILATCGWTAEAKQEGVACLAELRTQNVGRLDFDYNPPLGLDITSAASLSFSRDDYNKVAALELTTVNR